MSATKIRNDHTRKRLPSVRAKNGMKIIKWYNKSPPNKWKRKLWPVLFVWRPHLFTLQLSIHFFQLFVFAGALGSVCVRVYVNDGLCWIFGHTKSNKRNTHLIYVKCVQFIWMVAGLYIGHCPYIQLATCLPSIFRARMNAVNFA